MITLAPLERLLVDSRPIENEITELRFGEIVTCIEQEKITEAMKLIAKILEEGNLDIRVIVYYFYGYFLDHGIKSFKEIFPLITTLVNDHWEQLTPIQKRDKHVENSLNWFFTQFINKMKYYQKLYNKGQTHPVWEKSVLRTSLTELEQQIATSKQFRDFFFRKWPESSNKEKIAHLIKWMEELKPILSGKESPPPSIVEEEMVTVAPEVIFKEKSTPTPTEEKVATPQPYASLTEQEKILISSEEMKNLIKKLQIFETLIEKKEYQKAALAADNLSIVIENFDPTIYFPKLFSSYFSILAKNINSISAYWEERESLEWKCLEKLYKTDIENFMTW